LVKKKVKGRDTAIWCNNQSLLIATKRRIKTEPLRLQEIAHTRDTIGQKRKSQKLTITCLRWTLVA